MYGSDEIIIGDKAFEVGGLLTGLGNTRYIQIRNGWGGHSIKA